MRRTKVLSTGALSEGIGMLDLNNTLIAVMPGTLASSRKRSRTISGLVEKVLEHFCGYEYYDKGRTRFRRRHRRKLANHMFTGEHKKVVLVSKSKGAVEAHAMLRENWQVIVDAFESGRLEALYLLAVDAHGSVLFDRIAGVFGVGGQELPALPRELTDRQGFWMDCLYQRREWPRGCGCPSAENVLLNSADHFSITDATQPAGKAVMYRLEAVLHGLACRSIPG